MRNYQILQILSDGQFHSGEKLGKQLSVSRTSIWKALQNLESLGLDIQAVQGKGYRLANSMELLQKSQIEASLTAQFALEVLWEIDSTNRYLLRQIAAGEKGPLACLAERQTMGRGRRGRPWISPFGCNLYLSMSWRFSDAHVAMEGLSLVIALAVTKTLHAYGLRGMGVKWPNDVLWDGKKLAGILLEMSGEASGPCDLVIGIGLNVKMPKADAESIDQPWTDLSQILGFEVSRNTLAAALLNQLHEDISLYEQQGLNPFLTDWQQYDLVSGQNIELKLHGKQVHGVARGIDASGALLVETGQGVQRYFSGEVSVRLSS